MLYQNYKLAPWDSDRWPNFSRHELCCKCNKRFCDEEYWHDPDFLDALQALRNKIGQPLVINSGHRDPLWNALVGGAPLSMHKTIAVDISLRGHDFHNLKEQAITLGFRGIGMGNTFLHIDRRQVPAFWFYGPKSIEKWRK